MHNAQHDRETHLNEIRSHARILAAEFDWLCAVAAWRSQPPAMAGTKPQAPPLSAADGLYGDLVHYYHLGEAERLVMCLALAPHLHPAAMDYLYQLQQQPGSELRTQLVRTPAGQIWPVGFTALWLLAGNDLAEQFAARELWEPEHFFARHSLLKIFPQSGHDSRLMGLIQINEDYVDLFTTGQIRKPDFNLHFPAKRLHTTLDWNDLVLEPSTARHVEDIITWLKYHTRLMEDWGMQRVLKPGYKALFHGPPGTGKTLTAALLGKSSGLDVYRIDLSMVVSKYIGETEKNLEKVFARAEHKNWILFFDEADALFGKRTGISDAHDKYANQEVSYLLQRLEDYNGLVILSSNQRGNVDDAFARRLQSVIYFPLPNAADRMQLWQNAFSPKSRLEDGFNIEWLAEKYELAGGAIINVVQYASLQALRRNEAIIRRKDLVEGIRREYNKEGRTL